MTTQANLTNAPVNITDPLVLGFHTQRMNAYTEARTQVKTFYSELDTSVTNIKTFTAEVRAEGGKMQDGETVLSLEEDLTASSIEKPAQFSETDLIKQKNTYLAQYYKFKTIYERATSLTNNISSTIAFLTPPTRSLTNQQSLQNDYPELYEQIKQSEEICSKKIKNLETCFNKVTTLKDRLITSINDKELTWSLQRFCAIVDNKGQPLPRSVLVTLGGTYYFGGGTIPKPETKLMINAKPAEKSQLSSPSASGSSISLTEVDVAGSEEGLTPNPSSTQQQ